MILYKEIYKRKKLRCVDRSLRKVPAYVGVDQLLVRARAVMCAAILKGSENSKLHTLACLPFKFPTGVNSKTSKAALASGRALTL